MLEVVVSLHQAVSDSALPDDLEQTVVDVVRSLAVQRSVASTTRRSRNTAPRDTATRALREALEPYVDLRKLRRLATHGGDLQEALIVGAVPDDVQAMIAFVAELLPPGRA